MSRPSQGAPTPVGQQVVAIRSVDPINGRAWGYTPQRNTVIVDLRYGVGGMHIIPCVGEQWVLRKFSGQWALDRRLPFNNRVALNIADNPVPGMTQLGASSPDAGPTIVEGNQVHITSNKLRLGDTYYRDYQGQLQYSTDGGQTWNTITGTASGEVVSWSSLADVPDTFPSDWSTLANTPPDFPTTWSDVADKPARFPPILPTGQASASTFWCGDDTWKVPPGSGGGALTVGTTPTGSVDGSNDTFTLPAFVSGSTGVYLNGLRQRSGVDYAESSDTTITFTTPPAPGGLLGVDFVDAGVTANDLVVGETPSGVTDGSNVSFATSRHYASSSTMVYRNGLREELNGGYSEQDNNTLIFTTPPLPTDLLQVDYLITT